MRTPARRIHTGNRISDDAQSNGRDAIGRLNRLIFDGGFLLYAEAGAPDGSGLAFASGVTRTLAHGLGRKALGFFEVYGADVPSAAQVGLRSAALPSPLTSNTHIAVTPTGTGTCFVFVF